ncbi:MAG: nucleoside deaminase [Actinomycetaceae bacterium]|nr:nucleoside deaminase [Actinomycetaceae bacterium]
MNDPRFAQFAPALDEAYLLAREAWEVSGDVPVGAVVLDGQGQIIGRGRNSRECGPDFDPSAHAEVVALREAARVLGRWRLDDCTLVVTLEPCLMCAGALVAARVRRVVFGAWDVKAGACGSVRDVVRDVRQNHQVEVVGGIDEMRCGGLLQDFFAALR